MKLSPLIALIALPWILSLPAVSANRAARGEVAAAELSTAHGAVSRLPSAFVPNRGQWAHPARFVARAGGMAALLDAGGWTLALGGHAGSARPGSRIMVPDSATTGSAGVAIRMSFVGAAPASLVAEGRLPGRHHYLLGSDPTRWRTDVPLHAAVRYREPWPGVDVRVREHDGHFEYDLLLQPDADLAAIAIAVEGVDGMSLGPDGALTFETALGPVRMPSPLTWEADGNGNQQPLACRYLRLAEDRFGFAVPARRAGWSLVVDPGLVWSTFLGGTAFSPDGADAVAVDAQGTTFVVGRTGMGFPTTPGAFDTTFHGRFNDGFVTRLSADGASLLYSTYLGGSSWDYPRAVVLHEDGAVTVAGMTHSTDFPTTAGAYDVVHGGNNTYDGFVTRLAPDGASLVFSTLFGGADYEGVNALAVGPGGTLTVAGSTRSTDFPATPGAFDTSYNGGALEGDAYVLQLSPTAARLLRATYLGGSGEDTAWGVAVDAHGAPTIVGETKSVDFPVQSGSFDTSFGGPGDGFVTRLDASFGALAFSTFLGGGGPDVARAVTLDGEGEAIVGGFTGAPDFPTTPGAFDTTYQSGDAFVTRLTAGGDRLRYSTLLGADGLDVVLALALDSLGAVVVTGATRSLFFPTTAGAFDTIFNGPGLFVGDAFVSRLSSDGARLFYSTFLGGSGHDEASAVVVDRAGIATVAGYTYSIDYPVTPGAFDPRFDGLEEAIVSRVEMLPTGVATFGRASAGCRGPLSISVTSMPQVGNAAFSLTCSNAPPGQTDILVLAARRLATPDLLFGVEVWIDRTAAFVAVPATSDARGACEVVVPVPGLPSLAGMQIFAQFLWRGAPLPAWCPPTASNALAILIQP